MFSQPAVRHTTHTYVPAVLCNYGVILFLCTKKLGHEISNWLIINMMILEQTEILVWWLQT